MSNELRAIWEYFYKTVIHGVFWCTVWVGIFGLAVEGMYYSATKIKYAVINTSEQVIERYEEPVQPELGLEKFVPLPDEYEGLEV